MVSHYSKMPNKTGTLMWAALCFSKTKSTTSWSIYKLNRLNARGESHPMVNNQWPKLSMLVPESNCFVWIQTKKGRTRLRMKLWTAIMHTTRPLQQLRITSTAPLQVLLRRHLEGCLTLVVSLRCWSTSFTASVERASRLLLSQNKLIP